ncbi:hypothetical protein BDR26DRAFT_875545 [Obelidium mucronatum]|nr:hypothetical protein BDR26DRAFT_875545 [Obelidium mucronatum]
MLDDSRQFDFWSDLYIHMNSDIDVSNFGTLPTMYNNNQAPDSNNIDSLLSSNIDYNASSHHHFNMGTPETPLYTQLPPLPLPLSSSSYFPNKLNSELARLMQTPETPLFTQSPAMALVNPLYDPLLLVQQTPLIMMPQSPPMPISTIAPPSIMDSFDLLRQLKDDKSSPCFSKSPETVPLTTQRPRKSRKALTISTNSYDESVGTSGSSNTSNNGNSSSNSSSSSNSKDYQRIPIPRRKKEVLKKLFDENPSPSPAQLTDISERLEIPRMKIRIWFQNQRSNKKKHLDE